MRKHEDVYRNVILRRDAGDGTVRLSEHTWEYIVGAVVCAVVVLVMVQIVPRAITPSELENTIQTESESESKTEKPTIKESQYDLDKVIWAKEPPVGGSEGYRCVEYNGILMYEEMRDLVEHGDTNSVIAISITYYDPSDEEPIALINKLEQLGEVRTARDDKSGKIVHIEALLTIEQFKKIDASDVTGHSISMIPRSVYENYTGYCYVATFSPK